jgi:DNA-binding MarR family transcriptional regulator
MGLLKPRTATVLIYQGDDLERLSELRRAADVAERRATEAARGPRRGGDEIPNADVEQAAYDEAVDEAAERAVEVELTAIGRRRWRDLLAEHPPRTETIDGKEQTVEDDALYEVDTEAFPLALLSYIDSDDSDVRTITGPSFKDRKTLTAFLEDEAAEGDFERLWTTAYWLNRAPGSDPKDSKFSTGSLRSDEN